MVNYDDLRREIYSDMDDWSYLAYVCNDPIAKEEMNRLERNLQELYNDAKKDRWEWETID